jgi:hypothetical protein
LISTRPLPKSSTNCQVSDPRVPRRSFLIARTTERMISLIAKSFHSTSTTKLKTRSLHDKQLRRGLQLLLVPQLPQPRPSDGGTPPRSSKERSTTSPRVTRARRKTVALRRRNANSQYVTTESPSLDFAVIIPNFTTRPAANPFANSCCQGGDRRRRVCVAGQWRRSWTCAGGSALPQKAHLLPARLRAS